MKKHVLSTIRGENSFGNKRAQLVRFLVLAFALAGASVAFGQSIGTILGVVKDSSGAAVPGAAVTITNTETSATRTSTTGDDGSFRVPGLPVGHYTVKFEKTGFKSETQQGLVLDVAQDLVANSTLQVGTSAQEVVVTAEAPVVNTTNGTLGSLINDQKVAELPLNGRNYIDLTLLQPGVMEQKSAVGSGGGQAGTYFSSNGASDKSNNYTLDGAMLQNQYSGSTSSESGTTLGIDGIREVKIITSSFSAEYGMSMGAQMVMVSKGGSNNWHGDAFEYIRNSALDARNFFDYGYQTPGAPRLPEFQRNNFGAAAGGPIKKDKTFFFLVYEGLRQNLGVTNVDNVMPAACHNLQVNGANFKFPDLATAQSCGGTGTTLTASSVIPGVIKPFLDLFPSPNLAGPNNAAEFTFPATSTNRQDFGQLRVDQNISTADSFFARYTFDDGHLNNANNNTSSNSTGVAFPEFRIFGSSRNQFVTLSENHVYSPTVLNTLRGSYSRTNFDAANSYLQPLVGPQYSLMPGMPFGSITVTGLSVLGGNGSYPTVHIQNIFTGSDDVFYTRGRHAFKFGFLANHFTQHLSPSQGFTGSMTFPNTSNFMQGFFSTYTGQTFGSIEYRYFTYWTLGLYAQDDIRVTNKLTVNLGLRYEADTTPREKNGIQAAFRNVTDPNPSVGPIFGNNPSLKNFSPRIGFAWDVFGTGKTSVRAAGGIYYDVGNIGSLLEQEAVGTAPFVSKSTVSKNPTGSTIITIPFAFPAGTVGKTVQSVSYNVQQPHVFQYNLTVEQQLPGGIGLQVSYVALRGLNLWSIREGNPEIPCSISGFVENWNTCTPIRVNQAANPALATPWGSFTYGETASDSRYNSLQIGLNKRLSHGLQFQAAYTWSKSLDDAQAQTNGSDCGNTGGTSGTDTLFPDVWDKGPSCFDLTHVLHFNLIYHLPNVKSNGMVSKLVNGWWVGNILSWQTGYPFTPTVATNRSNNGYLGAATDRASLGTTTQSSTFSCTGTGSAFPGAPACNGTSVTYTYVPFDSKTVITGNPNMWFNPLMFGLGPLGFLGNASRDMLRGPGLSNLNISFNKDTALPFLGEEGRLQFRAEIFNILNHANFGFPVGTVFTGATTKTGFASDTPIANVAQITTTATSSRQVQLALKVVF